MKTIQCVCGFGIGSSMFLKMNMDSIIQAEGLDVETLCGDIASCAANPCDAIFIARELADSVEGHVNIPLVLIDNFMDKDELKEKLVSFLKGE